MKENGPIASPTWPADAVERRALASLVPYARNARTHSEVQIAQIAASIREWGFTVPVLVDDAGTIIAGHGRVLAALQLGLGDVPVMVASGWSEAQKHAYVIADNKLTENAGWDFDLLQLEVADLASLNFDVDLLGFSDSEMAKLRYANAGLTDPDAAPPLPTEPIAQLGELWQLGRHRLACGDATNAGDVARALGGMQPHLMVTDPPYGVNYDAVWRVRAGLNQPTAAAGKVNNDDRVDWREAWTLFPGHVAYVWHSGLHSAEVFDSLAARRLRMRAQIVWVKTRPVIGRGAYHWQHEPCAYAVEDGADDVWRFIPEHEILSYAVGDGKAEWHGGRRQSTVWHIEHIKSETGHSAQKPVECMRRPIENNSEAGQAIYDPFMGSGTTIIAAEMTARACHGIEINPAYVDVAVERWQNFTGEKAKKVN
jgi:DNA modification methylase